MKSEKISGDREINRKSSDMILVRTAREHIREAAQSGKELRYHRPKGSDKDWEKQWEEISSVAGLSPQDGQFDIRRIMLEFQNRESFPRRKCGLSERCSCESYSSDVLPLHFMNIAPFLNADSVASLTTIYIGNLSSEIHSLYIRENDEVRPNQQWAELNFPAKPFPFIPAVC
ncbi:hypothetical protein CC78DRAFT_586309 [Lojkania enalia]|uniref:Uncharacterized protein n=1 Tax=Lojkania enalia TaxID=147567 RepID=A0A9P4N589_9PLEO|nr:hypothetical protein CC78DRAFT_586309 [Didymosphaeria enalia]